jgi:hypothetical protein
MHNAPPASLAARRVGAVLSALLVIGLPITSAAALGPSPSPAPSGSKASDAGRPRNATFGIGPATVKAPDARPNFTYSVTPGVTLTDHVAVINYSGQPLTLGVYGTDAVNTSTGGFGLLAGKDPPKDAGRWARVLIPGNKRAVTVAGRSRVILPVRVTVPADATPGDHVGGIVASLVTQGRDKNGANVKLDQRIAARLFIRVAGNLRPQLTIEHFAASYHHNLNPLGTGTAVLSYRVRNSGNVKLGGRPSVQVTGLFGSSDSARNLPDIALLLPGGTLDVRLVVTDVRPEFRETAALRIVPLVPTGDVNPGLRASTATTRFWAVPWTFLAIVLVAGFAGSWWRSRRRTSPGPRGRHAAAPTRGLKPQKASAKVGV